MSRRAPRIWLVVRVPMRKGEQLGLFGHQVTVKGHTRRTKHGIEHVAPHHRHQQGHGPVQPSLDFHRPPPAPEPPPETRAGPGRLFNEAELRARASEAPPAAPTPATPPKKRRARKGLREIPPPPNLAPVDDSPPGVATIPGASTEISPAPGLDPTGTVYHVGVEGDRWTAGALGRRDVASAALFHTSDGRTLKGREAVEEMKARGARILSMPGPHGGHRREHPEAPLVLVNPPAPHVWRPDQLAGDGVSVEQHLAEHAARHPSLVEIAARAAAARAAAPPATASPEPPPAPEPPAPAGADRTAFEGVFDNARALIGRHYGYREGHRHLDPLQDWLNTEIGPKGAWRAIATADGIDLTVRIGFRIGASKEKMKQASIDARAARDRFVAWLGDDYRPEGLELRYVNQGNGKTVGWTYDGSYSSTTSYVDGAFTTIRLKKPAPPKE